MAGGWAGGLSALAGGMGHLEEVLQQRKLLEMRQQERQQQQQMEQQRIALQAKQQETEAGERKRQLDLQDQTAGFARTKTNLDQFTPQDPLTPDVVADANKYGLGGSIRTVGKGQTALPSTRFAGDMSTMSQDPGAVEGMYRRQSPQERQEEDRQKESRELRAGDQAFRERQSVADREARTAQQEADRLSREGIADENNLTRAAITGMIQSGKSQGSQGTPYFTFMPEYDAQGRPVGVQSGNARTGEVKPVQGAGLNKQPPGDLGKQSIVNETALDQLDRLEQSFEEAKGSVGPLTGRISSLSQKVPGVAVDEKFAAFEAATSAFRNAVIKAITGAQMSEPEANRIRQQIPEITDKQEVWREKARMTRKNLMDLENRIKRDRPDGSGAANPATLKPGDAFMGGTFLGWK